MTTRGHIGSMLLALAVVLVMPWRLEAGQQTLAGDVQVGNDIGSITPTVEGVTNTYVFTPDSLNMAGYKIYYNAGQKHLILTNLTELTDSGGTAIIDTSRSVEYQNAGFAKIYASSRVALGGYIKTSAPVSRYGYDGGAVVVAAPSIDISGTTASGLSIESQGARNAGAVTLLATNVVLAGGIAAVANTTYGLLGGAVTIRDGAGGPARVAIGGDVTSYGRGGGAVSVTATDFSVSNIDTRSTYEYNAAGSVTVTATRAVAVGGYITTRGVGKWGNVYITGDGSIAVDGTTNGIGIETLVTKSNSAYYGGNITLVSSNGDITVTGGFDASATYGLTRRGVISLSATNGSIEVGSLDANLFKTISMQAGTGTYNSIEVTGVLTNFVVSEEEPKSFTFPTGCVIGNDIYYSLADNGAGLSGTYDIYVAAADTGKKLKEGPPPAPGATPATIENLPATNVTTAGATFKGYLAVAGDPAAAVYVLWGETNGAAGDDWAYTNSWTGGAWGSASYPSTNIAPLTQNRNYYYTFGAQNLASNVVATPVQYFITGALGLQVTDGSCGTNLTDTGTLVISRPDTCTNEALPVYYSLGGAEQFVTGNPASGFEIAKGETQRTITLQPRLPNWGAASNFTVALLPGPYPSASLASVEVTVEPAAYQDLTLAGDTTIGNNMDVVETPPDTVAVSGSNPYVYDLWTASLDMNGHKIYYNASARNVVLTNLTALTDSGGTAVIDTSAANEYAVAGSAKVYARSRVTLGGYATTAARLTKWGSGAGALAISAPSIVIGGTNAYGLSCDSRAGGGPGGPVTLWATNVMLAGGIGADGDVGAGGSGAGGAITIHDGAGGPARVAIGGSVTAYGKGGGAVTITGTGIVLSNINTRSQYELNAAGAVTVTATGTVAVGGYITAAHIGSGNGGAVSITAGGSIAVGGTTNGIGVETRTTQTDNSYTAGNITIVSTNGDIAIAGGFDASHGYGVSRRGAISLSATNGRITVGSLDANRFKSITLSAGASHAVRVTGVLTNFTVSESPKTITFPTNSVVTSDIYYDAKYNTAIPLSGEYAIFVATTDTGKMLRERWTGSAYRMR